jgi:hypothetical protein
MPMNGTIMLKLLTALAAICTVTACASKDISTEMLNKDLLDDAKPLYQTCLDDYKKTMSDDEAKKACTEKLKTSYKKVSKSYK